MRPLTGKRYEEIGLLRFINVIENRHTLLHSLFSQLIFIPNSPSNIAGPYVRQLEVAASCVELYHTTGVYT